MSFRNMSPGDSIWLTVTSTQMEWQACHYWEGFSLLILWTLTGCTRHRHQCYMLTMSKRIELATRCVLECPKDSCVVRMDWSCSVSAVDQVRDYLGTTMTERASHKWPFLFWSSRGWYYANVSWIGATGKLRTWITKVTTTKIYSTSWITTARNNTLSTCGGT